LEALTSIEVEAWRLRAGVPAIPAEVGPEDLPNEAGLDDVAISYTKGCYLGQEVMARLKSMGRVRRQLMRVVAGALVSVPTPAPLFQGEKKVGELRGVTSVPSGGSVGLAMCTLLALAPDEPLALAPSGLGVFSLTSHG
jgi:folate-binding protein YgfZ